MAAKVALFMITFATLKNGKMLLEKLKDYRIVLASKSPRRQELFKGMGIAFEVCQSDEEERLSPDWTPEEAVQQLAAQKAETVFRRLASETSGGAGVRPLLVIGGDTVVVQDGCILGKPRGREEAVRMLRGLSGRTHTVHSGLCVMTAEKCLLACDSTEVTFASLSEEEINYYLDTYAPYDKAGAYGIQEWIGLTGISCIKGSFYGVMGLPTFTLWKLLQQCLD